MSATSPPRRAALPSRGGTALPALVARVAIVASVATAVACGTSSSATPVLTIPPLAALSLTPARETVEPPPAGLADTLPPVAPPDVPPPPPAVTVEYAGEPADLAAFVDRYRAAFEVPDMPEADVAAAGARLCTYLERHADAAGTVDLETAVTEGDINEPGYPRAAWLLGFEIATASYCPELAVDGTGG